MSVGLEIYRFAEKIFPIARSITGDGCRSTLAEIKKVIPNLVIHEIPSGTRAFDWEVPLEWNVRDAWIETPSGERIAKFSENNLHLVGYSEPIECEMDFEELDLHLHSLASMPTAIPYVTSYYERRWGFCLPHDIRVSLPSGRYKVFIDSDFRRGNLTYGELLIPGKSEKEIFFSTYICHPSMANNETSGPAFLSYFAKYIAELKEREYSYRIIFVPETIGSIVYLSRNIQEMKKNIIAGFNISCVGDNKSYSFLPSRKNNTLADKVAQFTLKQMGIKYTAYSWLERGSDERQYCSPLVNLPVSSVMRSKYGEYREYHTSLDNLNFISAEGFDGTFNVYKRIIECIELNRTPIATFPCEPHMRKHELRQELPGERTADTGMLMSHILSLADGTLDLMDISEFIGINFKECCELIKRLNEKGLLVYK